MDKIEVDPKLFITCRLCLEEMGQYQIIPSVQQQIKFCFDFDVDPFDGLPQLICRGCELILSQFYSTKKKFQDKQNDLKSNIKGCSNNSAALQQQNIVTSSEQSECPQTVSEGTTQPKSFKLTLKRKHSNSPEKRNDGEPESDSCASSYSIVKKSRRNRPSKNSRKWRKKYDKYFVCKFCSNAYRDKRTLPKHMEKHKGLLEKYSNLINNCSVCIPRIDKKANLTGLQTTVVCDHEKIIQNGSANYSVLYKRKAEYYSDIENKSSPEHSDDSFIYKRKGKRLRLLSGSSNETVILEGSNKKDEITEPEHKRINDSGRGGVTSTIIEYVDIGDSSDSDGDQNKKANEVGAASNDQLKAKIISNSVTSCYNKFINRKESSENYKCNKDDLLQHKILSMGRKIINKKRFSCTGLLRYMENKHLEIHWNIIQSNPCNNKQSEFVHVRTKLKESRKTDKDLGWRSLGALTKAKEIVTLKSLLEKIDSSTSNVTPPNLLPSATLYIQTSNENEIQSKKLLNPNPVANPKQLPKKTNLYENQSNRATLGPSTSSNVSNDTLFHMPIITSTVSLAEISNQENITETEKRTENTSSQDTNSSQPFVSRIKVKPVSQLMPAPSSNNTGINSGFVSANWTVPVPANPTHDVTKSQSYPFEVPITSSQTRNTMNQNLQETEWVTMHTVEIPNHKTKSPFLYLMNLLQIHNLILMNSNAVVSTDFCCLIKFKSIFNQENKTGVTLCMSLYSDTRQFCIKIKDVTSDIDIQTLPPHWQWEILQLFRGDIADRLLENAKKVSKKMFDATSYFVSLLRCIVFRKNG